jgi:hypothetical protein
MARKPALLTLATALATLVPAASASALGAMNHSETLLADA